jgi:solute carrier family 25 phosphate transporter 3
MNILPTRTPATASPSLRSVPVGRLGSGAFLLVVLLPIFVTLPTVTAFAPATVRTTTVHSWLSFSRRQSTPQYNFRSRRTRSAATNTPTEEVDNDEASRSTLDSQNLLRAADTILQASPGIYGAPEINDDNNSNNAETSPIKSGHSAPSIATPTSRRILFASSLIAAGTALGGTGPGVRDAVAATSMSTSLALEGTKLQWQATPVNRRTGVTVYDAEQAGYNVRFVTYLSRFLLSFDPDCQRWWYNRAKDLPRLANSEQVNAQRLAQFAAFSASVEVGLQEYRDAEGPPRLLKALLTRYSPDDSEFLQRATAGSASPPLDEASKQKLEREIKAARRHIALLFGLMETNQPTKEITKVLAAIDNGSIVNVQIQDSGSGYAPGYGTPAVVFPEPDAGPNFERATGRAVLGPNGKILRVDVVNRGFGYKSAPTVTIQSPASLRFGNSTEMANSAQAQAKAFLFRAGPNKGRIERIQLTDPGKGYTTNEIIKIRFSSPELPATDGGVTATATAVLEYEVTGLEMIKNGTGYAVEKPINVYVDPPPLTARVNMNDPMMARIIPTDQLLPVTTIPTKEMRAKMPSPNDPASVAQRAALEAAKVSNGGCVGRACYDRPVVAVAYPRAERDSYTSFRDVNDTLRAQRIEKSLVAGLATPEQAQAYLVSGVSSSADLGADLPELPTFGAGTSSSTQLLSLLPAGIGLEYDLEKSRYVLSVDPNYADATGSMSRLVSKSKRAYDPDFGPRGRSPIEREMELGVATYLRFVASGAVCCSGVHLALTPIDVVKTKVQTDPDNYPGIVRGFKKQLEIGGVSGFFTGWAPTFLGFFVWGGLSYALTEFLRRYFTTLLGNSAAGLEIPIILSASAFAAFVGSFVLCPFESVRIRTVAQPDYGSNVVDVVKRIVREEGLFSLFKAVPLFCAKEIPFAMGKFTVFDLSTKYLYEQFPTAREDIQLSLLISLAGGTIGGLVAAVVSNPGDATISELKKAKSDMGPLEAGQLLVERGGPAALFTGLPLRMVFYPLVVSLQFLIYDSVRLALGVGSDDLKLYLDVLGGALRDTGAGTL